MNIIIGDPQNYFGAITETEAAEWQATMQVKIGAFKESGTWELGPLSAGCKPIACMWIFRNKEDVRGRVVG